MHHTMSLVGPDSVYGTVLVHVPSTEYYGMHCCCNHYDKVSQIE